MDLWSGYLSITQVNVLLAVPLRSLCVTVACGLLSSPQNHNHGRKIAAMFPPVQSGDFKTHFNQIQTKLVLKSL